MLASAHSVLHFDAFTLDPVRCVLMRGSSELPLRRQSFEVLRYLAEHAGKVVSSDELVQAVWVAKPADDTSSVAQCIMEIRRALGDDSRWIIKTVSARGYEFKAEVVPLHHSLLEVADDPGSAASTAGPHPPVGTMTVRGSDYPRSRFGSNTLTWRQLVFAAALVAFTLGATGWLLHPRPAAVSPDVLTMMAAPTVAVLPFKVLGASTGQRDVAAAFGEAIRSELGRAMRGFDLTIKSATDQKVRPFASKADGGQLGVRYLVLGTTWRERDIQHANVQLLDSGTQRQVWSEPFEFTAGDARALNRQAARIARMLINQLRIAESRRPLPTKPEAGHFTLLANNIRESKRGSKPAFEAQSLFEKALAINPISIPALQGYAGTKIAQVRNGWIPVEQWPAALAQANDAIERIIGLDTNSVEGHYLRGALLRELGDVDQSIAAFEYSLSLNPNYAMAHAHLGRIKIDAGRANEAIGHIEEAILLSPADSNVYVYYFWAGMAALHLGDDQAALQWLLKARQADRAYPFTALYLALAYLGLGDVEKAQASYTEFLKDVPRYSIEGWRRGMPARNPAVAEQRKRIEDALRHLGVAEVRAGPSQH